MGEHRLAGGSVTVHAEFGDGSEDGCVGVHASSVPRSTTSLVPILVPALMIGVWLRCSDVMLPWVGRRRGSGIRGRVVVLGPGATSSSSGSRRFCAVSRRLAGRWGRLGRLRATGATCRDERQLRLAHPQWSSCRRLWGPQGRQHLRTEGRGRADRRRGGGGSF